MGFQDPAGLTAFIQRQSALGRLIYPDYQSTQAITAGGTNFCPNSDFAWSHMAATTAGITPATAGDTNYEIYSVFRQVQGANIGTDRVRSSGHSLYAANEGVSTWIPIWDRVQGNVHLGTGTIGAANYDIAVQMTNSWLQNNRFRYVRVAVATDGTTPLPVGAKLYAGYWAKFSGGTEGWVTGDGFTISYRRHAPVGTRHLQYLVIAKTSVGTSLESAVLDVLDAPTDLDSNNYIELTYSDATGFIQFEVYRKDVATGRVDLIANDVNSSQLWAYDIGQSIRVETAGFPSGDMTDHRAYSEVLLDAVDYAQQLTFHDLKVRVPATFDTSHLVTVYLRIGIKDLVAADRQIILDTVWESDSFNVWSPSAFDVYPSPRSTTLATAPPSGGTNPTDHPPVGGGVSCLWTGHDILTSGGWLKLEELREGMRVKTGAPLPNLVERIRWATVSQYFILEFSNGAVLIATGSHRFARSLYDGSGVQVANMEAGDTVLGGDTSQGDYDITLLSKELVSASAQLPVATLKHTANSPNKLYRVGCKLTGVYVNSHNLKSPDL